MKDLSALTHSFQEWSAVLDFLRTLNQTKEIKDIHIERDADKKWMMKISEMNDKRKPKTRVVAVYDLYW